MPRKSLLRSDCNPYHVTLRANNREPFHLGLEKCWEIFSYHLFEIYVLYRVQIHAFVLMPNHIHLLITVPHEDLGVVMKRFIESVTRSLNAKSGRSGRVFGARYHWTLIDSPLYFAHALKYVYRNPVKANLCSLVENFPYSTLGGLLGHHPLGFPLSFPTECIGLGLSSRADEQLDWLNIPFQKEHDQAMTDRFKRTRFAPAKRNCDERLEFLRIGLV